jgi:serine/threonine protein kinase
MSIFPISPVATGFLSRPGMITSTDPPSNYNLIKGLGQIGGANHYCMDVVEHRATKRILLRKKSKICHFDRPKTARCLETMRSLRGHPNILEFVDGFATPYEAALYTPIADLGSMNDVMFFSRNTAYMMPRRRGGDIELGEIPKAFIWHVIRSLLTAVAYIHIGYKTLEETVAITGLTPGWDRIVHGDLHTGNLLVQSTKKVGQYPNIILGDWDGCTRFSEHMEGFPGVPLAGPAEAFRMGLKTDLLRVITAMWTLCNAAPSARRPIDRIISKCHEGAPQLAGPNSLTVDARGMAKLFVEAEKTADLIYEEPEGIFKTVINIEAFREGNPGRE